LVGNTQKYEIREGTEADAPAVFELMPQLADFELPPGRVSDHLWASDAKLLEQHLAGEAGPVIYLVAVDDDNRLLGFSLTSLRPELLSHEPSAHLEAIAVAPGARGMGLGRALLKATEEAAKAGGAQSITLHAFKRNERARGLYEAEGYDSELIRYTKPLA
jgi:ribosomal protein S18 acetylase RimI-like enzyme